MATDLQRVKEIFLAAVEKSSSPERQAFLQQACEADEELRRQVEALLRQHEQASGFLESPPPGLAQTVGSDQGEAGSPPSPAASGPKAVGRRIGPYKLLQKLGEGGMGTVWVAEQLEPVKRLVALKIIKAGMDSAQVIARFEAERQALAVMDHPNIARVLDAGTTDTGRPYFVMELVKGIPITKYCDQEHQTPRERLELFIPVCQAVQHAHQKGIIHRDLKPSNVLIALYDGKPVPKVIDFGVAKATAQKLTERTVFTEVGQIVGTLEYMAPEQAELNNLDIDTRADIYSLGVILYELLTGSPPFTAKQLRSAVFTDMLRMIREVEPPRPSTRLSASEELPAIAANRKLEPRRLTKLVHGDLDWIAMKCLAKERNRRYETANGLAMDIQRYLADEPVLAGPPSVGYRLRKAVRRNKGRVQAAAIVLFVVLAGAVLSIWQAVRATQAAAAERQAKNTAEKRLGQVEKAIDLIGSLFTGLDPQAEEKEGKPLRALLGERLDQATRELESDAVGDPLEVARLQMKLGACQVGLGYPQKAIPLFTKARATFTAERGFDHRDTLASMNHLASAYHYAGELREALKLFEETLQLRQRLVGPDHADTLTSMHNVAEACFALGRTQDAIQLHEQTLELRKAKLGHDHRDALVSMHSLAVSYNAAARFRDAIKLLEEALPLWRATLGQHHRETLRTMIGLANCYAAAGLSDEALRMRLDALPLLRTKLGPDHPDTLMCMDSLADSYAAPSQRGEALKLREEVLQLVKARFGRQHPRTLGAMNSLGISYWEAHRHQDALDLFQEVLAINKVRLGPDHPDTLKFMNNVAEGYRQTGRDEEALKLREETLRRMKVKLGPDNPSTIWAMHNLAISYAEAGRAEEAMQLREEKLRLQRNKLGSNHPDTLRSLNGLAVNYLMAKRSAEAEPLAREAVERQRKRVQAAQSAIVLDHELSQLARCLSALGDSLTRNGKPAEAEPLLREGLTFREKKEPDAWATFHIKALLGGALLGQKKYDVAAPLLADGFRGMKTREARIPREQRKIYLPEALQRLIQLYVAWDKPDEAARWRKELEAAKKPGKKK
jgi:serine/threonine protein kinase